MKFTQKDIVKIKGERLPEGIGPHPFIIINCEKCISNDKEVRRYVGAMITHSTNKDGFTFELKPEMVDGGNATGYQQIRTNLIVGFRESDISPDSTHYVGRMKKIFFQKLMEEIKNYTLSIDVP